MKIETDRATVLSGVRHGRTLGSPIALEIQNRDYANWEERMNPWPVAAEVAELHLPRPGHAFSHPADGGFLGQRRPTGRRYLALR